MEKLEEFENRVEDRSLAIPFPSLRTVRDSFPSHGSSSSKVPLVVGNVLFYLLPVGSREIIILHAERRAISRLRVNQKTIRWKSTS